MRIIKLLVLFISISINGISQTDQLNENEVINIEQSSQNELDGLTTSIFSIQMICQCLIT